MKADYVHKDTLTATDYVELNKKYENAVADYETTMSELQELRKQLEEKENIACNWKDSCLENAGKIEELENQQKEFIKYMNSCIKELEKGSPNKLQNTINLGIIDITKTILQKYKSVIGVSYENNMGK